MVPSRYAQTDFAPELSKAITFFLRSNPGEISHPNSPNRELSTDLSDLEVRRRKVALHTISHLPPTEAWRNAFPPLGRVVGFRAKYCKKTERWFWGWAKFEERGTHG